MERCALTQVPCREAIAEIVAENKNRYFLQRTYEVAKILLDLNVDVTTINASLFHDVMINCYKTYEFLVNDFG